MGCDGCVAQDVDGGAIILAERNIAIGDEVRCTNLGTNRFRARCVVSYSLRISLVWQGRTDMRVNFISEGIDCYIRVYTFDLVIILIEF